MEALTNSFNNTSDTIEDITAEDIYYGFQAIILIVVILLILVIASGGGLS